MRFAGDILRLFDGVGTFVEDLYGIPSIPGFPRRVLNTVNQVQPAEVASALKDLNAALKASEFKVEKIGPELDAHAPGIRIQRPSAQDVGNHVRRGTGRLHQGHGPGQK